MPEELDAIVALRLTGEKCRQDKSCWGPLIWKTLDKTCDLIPCDTCREHCHSMISAEHDVVNVLLGKPVHNISNLEKHLRLDETVKSKLRLEAKPYIIEQ